MLTGELEEESWRKGGEGKDLVGLIGTFHYFLCNAACRVQQGAGQEI